MLLNGSYQDNQVFFHNGYFYFIGGYKNNEAINVITKASYDEVNNYLLSYRDEPIFDEVVGHLDENVFYYGLLHLQDYVILVGGADTHSSKSMYYILKIDNEKVYVVDKGKLPFKRSMVKLFFTLEDNIETVYIVGGYDTHCQNEIFKARFIHGKLTGFTLIGHLPISLCGYSLLKKDRVVFLVGGNTLHNKGSQNLYVSYDNCRSWVQLRGLDFSISYSFMFSQESKIFMIGGLINEEPSDSVLTTNILSDSHITNFQHYKHLKKPVYFPNAVKVGNKVYLFGYYNKGGIWIDEIMAVYL